MLKHIYKLLLISLFLPLAAEDKTVLLAILARNKAHVLPHYLKCIENLNYDKAKIIVYINTNNNQDNTLSILYHWKKRHEGHYRKIILEAREFLDMPKTKPHKWNSQRFKVLGQIRNRSLEMAKLCNCNFYFVVDCDNFLTPCTLRTLIQKNRPIVAPMLRAIPVVGDTYSNFFCNNKAEYSKIVSRQWVGTFEVPLVHCTYLIQAPFLNRLTYQDGTSQYEYVIFSRSARRAGVGQFICNEKNFGEILHLGTELTLPEERKLFREWLNLHP